MGNQDLELEYQNVTNELAKAKQRVIELEAKQKEIEKQLLDGTEYAQFYYS